MLSVLKRSCEDFYINSLKERVRVSMFARPYIKDISTMTMPFARRNCRWSTVPSPIGTGERSIFEERIVDGVRSLVITGKDNWKDFIESSKDETLIDNIIRRFENGDVYALSRSQGFYGDVTGMPSTLAESQNFLIKLRSQFDSLPVDVRRKFDNSFDKYVATVSSMSVDEFNSAFVVNSTEKVVTNESEVVSNES